ncbi:MAG: Ig-like domain-containing protein [Candidatus Acidiferrum sp.]
MNRSPCFALSALMLCMIFSVISSSRAQAQSATTTIVTASANPITIGSQLTYTITVTSAGSAPLTGPLRVTFNGNNGPDYSLHNGSVAITSTVTGPPHIIQVIASYLGDSANAPSTSVALNEVIIADLGLTPSTTSVTASINPAYPYQTVTYTATVIGGKSPTGTVNFYLGSTTPFPAVLGSNGIATMVNSYASAGNYAVSANYSGDSNNAGSVSPPIEQVVVAAAAQPPLQFVPVTPCRVADTREAPGPFGGPLVGAGQTRSFAIPQSACGIPPTAAAYSLNVAVVPSGPLGFLTVWPAGTPVPAVALLTSYDGRVKSNAAIVPAGTSGAISVYALNATQVIVDINGYFAPPDSSSLAFYPVTPCRMVDTRNPTGPLGGPYIAGGQSRAFPLRSSNCNIPPTAQVYSLNVAAVPAGPLGFLTIWPTGQPQPTASTLNAYTGTVTANAAIVGAGANGNVSVFVTNDADVVLDVNGYFAPPGVGGLSLYSTTPCRMFDSRNFPYPPFPGTFIVAPAQSYCTLSNAAAAYVLNATVVPQGSLGSLTLWPTTSPQPLVSTLNALDGAVTSNMAIVPTNDNNIAVYAPSVTQLILDVSAYFAP